MEYTGRPSAEDSQLLPTHNGENEKFYGEPETNHAMTEDWTSRFSLDSWGNNERVASFWDYAPKGLAARAFLVVMVYLTIGVFVYTQVADFTLLDALYFCIVTVTTVGYGDLSNHSDGTKIFACIYILFGVAMIGGLISSLVEMVLEQQEEMLVAMLAKGEVTSPAAEETLHVNPSLNASSEASTFAPKPKRKMTAAQVRAFNSVVIFVALVCLGVVVFGTNDQLDIVDSLYLTIVSASTVGYGDFSPSNAASKTFAIFFLPLATLCLAKIVSDFTEMRMEDKREATLRRVLNAAITKKEFRAMDVDGDGKISEMEYLCRGLVAQDLVTREDIAQIVDRFREIDKNRNGFLEEEECVFGS